MENIQQTDIKLESFNNIKIIKSEYSGISVNSSEYNKTSKNSNSLGSITPKSLYVIKYMAENTAMLHT
jgi:hypothetical protein